MKRIGIDIGGTFTDFVTYDPSSGEITSIKLLSTPNNPAEAVLQGLALIPGANTATIVHGSTVATNALLERKGARAALITTQGFADVLQIGRQNRPSLYDWSTDPLPPLVPSELRFEICERVSHTGEVIQGLNSTDIDGMILKLKDLNIESIALCLLFSFLHPEHESVIAGRTRASGFSVSVSSEILPEFREYERTSTTVVNAYVSPVLNKYLSHIQNDLPAAKLQVMQSNGGMISIAEAQRNGVRCILSGPAGGVIATQFIGETISNSSPHHTDDQRKIRLIAFDMGGTSTDVSLIEGQPQLTTESSVGGCPIAIPMLDIHTIGAGGGSIASVDPGGALRVGPQSAGADPGPACYGKGESPTVTDANLVLGRLAPEYFLGGKMPLHADHAEASLARLGEEMKMSLGEAALGVIDVVNAHMERALRVISVERGHDPREFSLFTYGGAGGLHAADLARRLGIPRVIISPMASTLSAFGMLAADTIKDYSQTLMLPWGTSLNEIKSGLDHLVEKGRQELINEGIPPKNIEIERMVDLRYAGQSYELTIPYSDTVDQEFHKTHYRIYGNSHPNSPLEIVNIRVRVVGKITPPLIPRLFGDSKDPSTALIGKREVIFSHRSECIPFYQGESLLPGNIIPGPAMIIRQDTTILIGSTDHAEVDCYQNVILFIDQK